jgi:hypothetical protein
MPVPESHSSQYNKGMAAYYAARKNGLTIPALLRSWGRPSPLHTAEREGSAIPPDPYREGWAATPPRTLPRTVRSRLERRLFYSPRSRFTATPLSNLIIKCLALPEPNLEVDQLLGWEQTNCRRTRTAHERRASRCGIRWIKRSDYPRRAT